MKMSEKRKVRLAHASAPLHLFDEFLRFFEMVPEFGIEQQRLGWNAAHVQARAAEKSIFFNECGFQAPLARADGRGVSGRSAADDGDVINSFRQRISPQ